MNKVTLILPYPPSVNHYKRPGRLISTKSGRAFQIRVNTDATKRYYYEVWMKIQQLRQKEGLKSFGDAMISVEIDVHSPDKRKRDLDNICKVLCDSLQKAQLFDDDYQIARLLLTRCSIIPQGQLVVRIKELT